MIDSKSESSGPFRIGTGRMLFAAIIAFPLIGFAFRPG